MHLPVRRDAKILQTFVSFEKVGNTGKGVANMVHSHLCICICVEAIGAQHTHVCKGESMMFVIVSKKRKRGVLVLDPGVEYFFVPVEHLIIASGHVDHMGQFRGM